MGAVLVTIFADIFLSDRNAYLHVKEKSMTLYEILFLTLIVLTLVAFIFVWWFHKSPETPRNNPQNPSLLYSKYSKRLQGYEDKNFTVVDLNKIYPSGIPNEVYFENPD